MRDSDDHDSDDDDDHGHDHDHGPSGLTLAVAAVLVVAAGLFLSTRIRDMSRMQDCILAGRSNCAPVDASGGN
jgi:hypothetical protein